MNTLTYSEFHTRFAVAEQALNTIYLLGEHPDVLCGDIIKTRCKAIFDLTESKDSPQEQTAADFSQGSQSEEPTMNFDQPFTIDSWKLSQLLFIVGHVAIKHIVHMEVIEEEFKRRKAAAGSDKKKDKDSAVDDELDQVVGTTEDEFGDAMAHIRERELLFGEGSLLQVFGPLIITICGNNTLYSVCQVSKAMQWSPSVVNGLIHNSLFYRIRLFRAQQLLHYAS